MRVKLNEIAKQRNEKIKPNTNSMLTFIGMDSIEPHTTKPSNLYDFKDFKSAGNLFKNNDILYGRLRPYLNKVMRADFDGAASGEFIILEPETGIYPDFILYNLHSIAFVDFASKQVAGDRPRIKFDQIKKYNIYLPPLPEQRAIVSKIERLFSQLDNGVANLKAAKEKLEIYRQAVLKKAFEGELTREWREKQKNLPTADELLKQIEAEREAYYQKQLEEWEEKVKEWEENGEEGKKPVKPKKPKKVIKISTKEISSLSAIPGSWLYNFLAYAGDLGRGKSKHRPRNDPKLFGGKYPFIQTGDVKAQDIITEYTQTYNEAGLEQSKLWPKGTMCITIAANIAETGFLGMDACFPDSVVGFTPFQEVVHKYYIEYFFRLAKYKISAYAPATAQKNINLATLENLIIPFCSIEEQTQIVQEIETRLSVCDKFLSIIDETLEKSEALRQSILKKAFEGKLLSDDELTACKREPDWEPAEALLARIRESRDGQKRPAKNSAPKKKTDPPVKKKTVAKKRKMEKK